MFKNNLKYRNTAEVTDNAKGDYETTCEIAKHYERAIENGKWTLVSLADDGLPTLEDSDERNCWLYKGTHTFTTVHEAIEFLIELKNNNRLSEYYIL